MTNKIHIKLGAIEFEAEGDNELIERERDKFFSLLPQAIDAVSPGVHQASRLLEIKPVEDSFMELPIDTPISTQSIQNCGYESLAGFLRNKKFTTGVEIVMGVAYYIEYIDKLGSFTSKDIENALDESRQNKPGNISQMLTQNVKKGYLRAFKEKKDGLKTYCVLELGKNWCESYVAIEKKDDKKKSSRTGQQKPLVESALLGISIDELNLDKYCDVSKIKKFNEQMLVVILMYTKEKGIDYFTYNDIISIFKSKFRLPATTRQVSYSFESGGTMFDKKIEKRIAYYKLMNGGIKEAERIVADQRKV